MRPLVDWICKCTYISFPFSKINILIICYEMWLWRAENLRPGYIHVAVCWEASFSHSLRKIERNNLPEWVNLTNVYRDLRKINLHSNHSSTPYLIHDNDYKTENDTKTAQKQRMTIMSLNLAIMSMYRMYEKKNREHFAQAFNNFFQLVACDSFHWTFM